MSTTCTPTFERVATIDRTTPVVLCGTCGAIVPVVRGTNAFGDLAPMPTYSYVPEHAPRVTFTSTPEFDEDAAWSEILG